MTKRESPQHTYTYTNYEVHHPFRSAKSFRLATFCSVGDALAPSIRHIWRGASCFIRGTIYY